jgi:hypothetical protein
MTNNKPSPKLDLTETLIVLLLSAAITMFVFWIGSIYLGQERFRNVPEIFKSVWTSLATGAVGVAGAITKSFLSHRKDYPNYLLYIGVTTMLMLIPIAAIIYEGERSMAVRLEPPYGTHAIITGGQNADFVLNDAQPNPALRVTLSGSYRVEGQVLRGRLTSGTIRTNNAPNAPVHVDKIVFRSCFLNQTGSLVSFYPPQPANSEIIDVDLQIAPSENLAVPPGTFSFQLPEKAILAQSWFCATLIGDPNFNYQVH